MSKNKDQNEEVIVDVTEVYSKTETFIEENKNILSIVVAGIAILVGGYFAYTSFYLKPLQEEAKQEMFMAEKYFSQDSLNLAMYGDDMYPGFIEIADEYGATKSGNLAHYYLGVCYLRTGQFEAAIQAMKNFDGSDAILKATKFGTIGDAYMELGDLKKAVSNYESAAESYKNEFSSPLYLMKAAKTHEMIGDYDEAIAAYEKIKEDYKGSPQAGEVEKYIAKAESFVQ